MKRLTEKHYGASDYYMACSEECERDPCLECAKLEKIVDLLGAYEDTGLTPAEIRSMRMDMAIIRTLFQGAEVERLKELAEADEEGRVVVLPCKVGDGLWTFCSHPVEQVYSFTVTDIGTLNGMTTLNTSRCGVIDARDVGKNVFLTREEAEKALEAWKDG